MSVEGSGGAEVLQVWSLAAGGALYYYTHQGSRISPSVIYMLQDPVSVKFLHSRKFQTIDHFSVSNVNSRYKIDTCYSSRLQ